MIPSPFTYHRTWMRVLLLACVTIEASAAEPSSPYQDYSSLTHTLKTLERERSDNVHVSSLCKSLENREVWLVEIGTGTTEERMKRPGFLLVAGIEGNRILDTDTAVSFLRYVCDTIQSETMTTILGSTTLYVIPRLNPDAIESYFMTPVTERSTTLTPFDDDRDGTHDEDPPEDLNGDGTMAWMRIDDPQGTFIAHPDDERITIPADPAKQEAGRWLYLPEGLDNDGDKLWNEDGVGGVQLNHNFTFGYPWFDPAAGLYPMSEPESKSLAEFMLAHPQIGLVFTFESRGNLLKAPETSEVTKEREPQTKIVAADGKLIEELGKEYRQAIGVDNEIETESVPGSFSDWIYFHRGRLALSTPLWTPELAVHLYPLPKEATPVEDSTETEETSAEPASPNSENKPNEKATDERAEVEFKYLQWIDRNAPDSFLSWQAFDHPDFPQQKTEIGGWKPYAMTVPPERYRIEVENKTIGYVVHLLKQLPKIAVHQTELKQIGPELFELTVLIRNNGFLPTVLAHGKRTDEVRPTRVELDLPQEKILSGSPRTTIEPLQAGESVELRYTLLAELNASVHIQVISECAGQDERMVELRKE